MSFRFNPVVWNGLQAPVTALKRGGLTSEAPGVHTTQEEFENGDFTLKTHQTFSVYTTPEKTQQPPIILDLCLELGQEITCG